MEQIVTRDNVRRIQKKLPSGMSGNDVVPSRHRDAFSPPQQCLSVAPDPGI